MKPDWFHIAILTWTVAVTVGGFAGLAFVISTPPDPLPPAIAARGNMEMMMDEKVEKAREYLARVPFPEMILGANGTIIDKDGRLVATMNLRDLSLTEAFTFASAFIAAGAALQEAPDGP